MAAQELADCDGGGRGSARRKSRAVPSAAHLGREASHVRAVRQVVLPALHAAASPDHQTRPTAHQVGLPTDRAEAAGLRARGTSTAGPRGGRTMTPAGWPARADTPR